MANKKCQKCGATITRIDDEDKCLSCGHVNMSIAQRKKFYLANAVEILQDIKALGPNVAARKWDIPLGSIRGLRDRLISKFPLLEQQKPAIERDPPGDKQLPQLPAWSDTWPEAVQILWLQVWLCLATRNDKES